MAFNRRRWLRAAASTFALGAAPAVGAPPLVAPSTPTGLRTTSASASEIALAWNPSTVKHASIAGYHVYRGGTLLSSVPGSQTWFNDKGLAAGTSYTYQVAAVSTRGTTSALCSAVTGTTLMVSAPSPAPSSGPGVPSEFFGMTIGGIAHTPWPTQIAFHGLRSWDVWVFSTLQQKYLGPQWCHINYANGQYDWALFDTFFEKANANGVKEIIFTLGKSPTWSNSARDSTLPPDDLSRWDTWVGEAVRRARDRWGRTGVNWEIWNEVGHSPTFRGGFYNGSWTHLAQMTRRAHDILKAADPAARVLMPSVQGNEANYLSLYFAADAGGGASPARYVDVLNTHHYFGFTGDGPEDYVTRGYYRNYRNLFATYGLNSKPWWDTETNTYANPNNQALQAGLVVRHWMLNWAEGISRTYFYAYDYDNVGQMWSGSGTGINAVGVAYNEMRRWLIGSSLEAPFATAGTVWTGTWTRASVPGYRALSTWNTAGSSSFTVPAGYNSFRDLSGASRPIPWDRRVVIGTSPLWFETSF